MKQIAAIEQQYLQRPLWTVGDELPFSKRHRQDAARVAKRGKERKLPPPRPKSAEVDPHEIALLCARHAALLNKLFEVCRNDSEKQSVIFALREFETNPGDPRAVSRWIEILRLLRAGPSY
jgi:hypothetical protein